MTDHYKVIVSERAQQMLLKHTAYLGNKDLDRAEEVKKRLLHGLRSLETMPSRYPFLEDQFIPSNRYRKMYIEKWYLVLYQIRDQNVLVDLILDCRHDYRWLLK